MLRELLVYNGVEVRGANRAPHAFIVKVCDEVFQGQEVPPPPPTRTLEEIVILDAAALRIQHAYTRKKAAQLEEEYNRAHIERNRRLMSSEGVIPNLMEPERRGSVSHRRGSTAEHQAAAQSSMMSHCETHKRGGKDVTKMNRKQLEDELAVPWKQPSLKFAEVYRRNNHPHHAIRVSGSTNLEEQAKHMDPYDHKKTTLGRHCVIGGCGEQLDLWDEGQVSEFGQFGSGITNYFKFLKWCWWIMFLLSIINTPALIMNR